MNVMACCLPLSLGRCRLALLVFLTLLLPSLAHAATLTVPAQYATIQAAINASQNGDTVLISDGTYTGPGNVDLDFGGRNITVTSQNGAITTAINCGGSSGDYHNYHRGFYFHSGETNAVISGLTIKNGYESGNYNGGGIAIAGGSTLAVTNCTITGNNGSGVYIYNGGKLIMTNCIISGNTAFAGGGVNNGYASGPAILTNCTVSGNTANYGGGVSTSGGGSTSTLTLINDILYGDTGGEVSGSGVTASYCDVQGGYAGTGNINADPLFVNRTIRDYHLKAGSPCFGAGTANGAPAIDADGYVRPNPPSIGAYEGVPGLAQTSITGTASLQGWMGTPQPLTYTLTPTGTTAGSVLTQTITPGSNGSFTLTGVPAGTYTLGVQASRWLKKNLAVDTTGGDLSGLSVSLLDGDVNGDGVVNGADISAISAAFRSRPGDAKWNANCDVNGDGVVNGADLSLASANFRKRSDP